MLLCQSLVFYYMLYDVRESEGALPAGASGLSLIQTEQRESDRELGYAGRLPCDVTAVSKTAVSAVKRAMTQKCKEELADVACRLKSNQLVPLSLPNYCQKPDSVPGQSLGCFHDAGQQRILSAYGARMKALTVDKCINICVQSSFPYSGIRNGDECYCGLEKPAQEAVLEARFCNSACHGETSQTCGGTDATQVYDTGIPPRESTKLNEATINAGNLSIAFVLTVNGRALRQVTRLLRVIYRPHHVYLIHVDARQDYLVRNLLPLERRFSNIHLTRKRLSTIWGGASLLDVLLESVQHLLKVHSSWQFVFNLSESDFPVRSVDKLENLLAANRGRNFLKSHGRQARQFIHKQGLDRVFHQCESRMWRVGDRQLPSGIRFDGGSDWIGLSRPFAQYAVEGNDALILGLKHLYRYTLLPAESFFHVLSLNSHFCSTYADNNLRMTLWRRNQGCLCQHRHVVDWCGCSPMVFRTADWSHLSALSTKNTIHFARKFESAIDQSIINRLEEIVTNTSVDYPGWDSYWESVFHVADVYPPANKALLAFAGSIARHSVSLLGQDSSWQCQLNAKSMRALAATSYFHRDNYKGDLILFDGVVDVGGGLTHGVQLEVYVKPLSKTRFFTTWRPLSLFQVASDYDPKEQVLRNRIGVLSQISKIVVHYKWAGVLDNGNATLQLVWFDPQLRVRAVHEANISDASKVIFINILLSFLIY